jgi:hypothetical protein
MPLYRLRRAARPCWPVLLLLLMGACRPEASSPQGEALARVHDRYLYAEDLSGIAFGELSPEDSAALVEDFIDRWIKQGLLLKVAESNLPDRLAEIEEQANAYRESLLTDAYLQEWLDQNLDTVVPEEALEAFYDAERAQFVLQHPVYRFDYVVVEQGVVNYDSLQGWFSDPERFQEELDRFCLLYCVDYHIDPQRWYGPRELKRSFPGVDFDPEALRNDRVAEIRHQERIILLRLRERRASGEPGPLAYWKDDIRQRILNKRRRDQVKQTYRDLYLEGQRREQFDIYSP